MQAGFLVLFTFASLWLIAGILSLPAQPMLKFLSILTLLAVAVRLPIPAYASPSAADTAFFAARATLFIAVNVLQYLCIAAAIFWTTRHHRRDILAVLVSLIVGLHFLLLAPLFQTPLYYGTGAAIIAADLLAFSTPSRLRNPVACILTGALLWSTALLLLHHPSHLKA